MRSMLRLLATLPALSHTVSGCASCTRVGQSPNVEPRVHNAIQRSGRVFFKFLPPALGPRRASSGGFFLASRLGLGILRLQMSHGRPSSRTTIADLDRSTLDDGVARLQRVLRDVRALDARTLKERRDERLETLQKRVNNVLSDMLGMSSPDYTKHKLKPIDGGLDTTFGDHYSLDEYREAVKEGLVKAAGAIEGTIAAMKAALAGEAPRSATPAPPPEPKPTPAPAPKATPAPPPPATAAPTPAPTAVHSPKPTPQPTPAPTAAPTPMKSPAPAPTSDASSRVLVLGNSDAGGNAAELLAQLGMEIAVIDSPTVDRLDGARDAGYAVVVGTEGGDSTMLAIGFLLALLGRSRIALLSDEVPEALSGCVHVPMDDDGLWRLLLAREMKKAGLEVDLNRAL